MDGTQQGLSPSNKTENGPHGLGDPDDLRLRKVEVEVMIPKKMREKAQKIKCAPEVKEFHNCCLEYGMRMVYKCRPENKIMKDCLTKWYNNEDFKKECREEYLKERSDYRRTGIGVKLKSQRMGY